MTPQVLIVGAGPVGLTMAIELARYKVPVRLIDRMQNRAATSRAVALWPRTFELLDRSGSSEEFTVKGNKVTSAIIFAGRNRLASMLFGGARLRLSLRAHAAAERDRVDPGTSAGGPRDPL